VQAERLHLLVIRCVACAVPSGLPLWAFVEGRSAAASAIFAARIQQHLHRQNVWLRDVRRGLAN